LIFQKIALSYYKPLKKSEKRKRAAKVERLNQKRKVHLARETGQLMMWQIKKVLHCHYPDLQGKLSTLPDPRTGIQYRIEELVMASLVLFLLNCDSRNDFNCMCKNEQFRQNYRRMFRMELPHMDAVNDLYKELEQKEIEKIQCRLISALIDKRVFHRLRFFGEFFYIAIDATGAYNWGNSPPEGIVDSALKKEYGSGKVNYSTQVFEAVLIFQNGMYLPLMSEWIANESEDVEKQDCELNAFKRLSVRLKEYFPRLNICFLADGLYSNVSMMNICRDMGWKFITVFKDGNLPSVWDEVNSLLGLKDGFCTMTQPVVDANRWMTRTYRWIKDIEYQKHKIHWIECVQETIHKTTGEKKTNRFVFLTNMDVDSNNIARILTAGRARWLIEDHFNTQKNREGSLHHKFSRNNFNALKNWHNVRQLAVTIKELVKHTCELQQLKKEDQKMTWKQLWKDINGYLSMCEVDTAMDEFELWSKSRRQVRLE
jgi:hypothetical protein